jgi:ElaB/YqjD/DUF883 family membrane-anchored ribosome-binding protein
MEQSNFSSDGITPNSTQAQSQGDTGTLGSGMQGGQGTQGTQGAQGTQGSQSAQGMTDRARDLAGSAQEKLADIGSTVRDRSGNLKASLADALSTGADRLRQRGASGGMQLASNAGVNVSSDTQDQAAQLTTRVAGGMDATADWLRDADLDSLRLSVERQVKDHPGRTLLIAAGVGYLLGKALKK